MQTYRRFVSYVYQYENGKKAGNRGFIKVEAKGSTCNIQISLKGICKDENTACSVYGFKREDGLLKGSLLAECPVKAGVVQEHLVLSRNEMGRAKYGLQELSGIIFQGNDRTMYGTQWDDDPMKMENFQPDEKNEEFTDSGSRFVEEEVEDQQSGNETPAGEWLIDGERMQEEINAKAAMEKSDAHRRLMSQWAKEAVYSDFILARSGTAATANAAYEANFVMADNSFI